MAAARVRISKDPEERRGEILTAARRLFQEQGYEKTSVQAITDAVGVAKGLFYHYFDSKADLLNQLAVWQAALYMDALPSPAEMEGDAVQKLRDFVGRTVQWKFEDLRTLTIAYLDVLYRDENTALRHALMSEFGDRLVPFFAEIIEEGNRESVCEAADPVVAAEQVVALSTGQGDRWARLLRAALDDPAQIEPLFDRLRGYEIAVERVLGMRPGSLRLYDYDYLRATFLGLARE